jgi:hypothetical protein
MTNKAQQKRDALAAWYRRVPAPAIVLSIDPGKVAGATLGISKPTGSTILKAESVEIAKTRRVESICREALDLSVEYRVPAIMVAEDWGRGGQRGIDQWIGLGEARGVWRREWRIACLERGAPSKIALITQSRWRSRILQNAGTHDDNDKWHPFGAEQWKAEAFRFANSEIIDYHIGEADVAESACQYLYAIRSDEVRELLGVRFLKTWGIVLDRLEPMITGKK